MSLAITAVLGYFVALSVSVNGSLLLAIALYLLELAQYYPVMAVSPYFEPCSGGFNSR